MKIHEYQGKSILAKFGVPVPKGEVVFAADEARGVAERLGGGTVVVKAQIHAGGRGKGGGVKVVTGPTEAFEAAKKMLGMTLVTHQTGAEGRVVQRILVEQGLQIARELYLGLVIDRSSRNGPIADGEPGRWHGDRESGGRNAGAHFQGVRRSRARPAAVPGA